MGRALNKAGFNAFNVTLPSPGELLQIFEIAAPVFVTMTSKVYDSSPISISIYFFFAPTYLSFCVSR